MVCDPPREDEELIFEGIIDLKSARQLSLDSLSSCHKADGTYSEKLLYVDWRDIKFFSIEIKGLIKENTLVPLDRRKGYLRFHLKGMRESELQSFTAYGTVGAVTVPPPGLDIWLKTPPDTPYTPLLIGVIVKLPGHILLDQPNYIIERK